MAANLSLLTRRALYGLKQQRYFSYTKTTSNNIKANQTKFQLDDDVPIYLKNGRKDRFVFGITVGLCVFALGNVFYTFYDMAFPKKKK